MNPSEAQSLVDTPPIARAERVETHLHGVTLTDDYGWLREKENPEVIEYLASENAYTDAFMECTKPLQSRLYQEMLSHIKETDESVPYKNGAYFYYSRTEAGKQYPLLCRKPDTLDNPEQIFLDVNQLADGLPFLSLGDTAISDDATMLAYSTDETGFRQYTLHVKHLESGETVSGIAQKVGSVAWAADNRTLFYTVEDDETKRQYRLYRHQLGTSEHVLVYEEPDERFNIGVERTRSRAYLLLTIASHTTSEGRFVSAHDADAEWRLIAPRQENIEYYVDHREDEFFLRTNDTGRNFRLVTVPVANTPISDPAEWKELVPARADVMLEGVDVFADFYVLEERTAGLSSLRVIPHTGPHNGEAQTIAFPEPTYSAAPNINAEFKTGKFRYSYQSLVTPASIYEYDLASGRSELKKQIEVPGGFDRNRYRSERVFAIAEDGTEIPISLVYRIDTKAADGSNPIYVYAYGSYGYSLPVGFNGARLSLLDRGVVMAYAHIRGGGEMGKQWHDLGRLAAKQNTFTDFISVVEFLVDHKYGARDRVAIEGGSAGGLLMGAVTNLRPDLFHVVLSHVPFVDVMNTMLDATLPLTVPEYEEWGDPNEDAAFRTMLAYSPYENLKPGAYPAILVKTSLNDSQVMYWEPAKYVAKLRNLKRDATPLLLHTNMNAGHGGASGRYDYLKEIAFDYAFLLTQLGVESSGSEASAGPGSQ